MTVREILLDVMKFKMNDIKNNPLYEVNKYNSEEYVEGLNEGVIKGLMIAIDTLENGIFLDN